MREMRYLDHAHRELLYLAAATSFAQCRHLRPFSKFSDKNRYAGTSPSTQYCKAVFVDSMRAYRPYFDRVIASLPATVVKGDHTFGVSYESLNANLRLVLFTRCSKQLSHPNARTVYRGTSFYLLCNKVLKPLLTEFQN